jgi:hypothetical protein
MPVQFGVRVVSAGCVAGHRRVGAISPDQKSLWLDRWREEGDLWLARLEK